MEGEAKRITGARAHAVSALRRLSCREEDKSGTKAPFRGLNGPRESSIPRLLRPSLISSFILESLEALLMCHPAVDDATVTGFYVKGIGHLPRAYVVIKKGYSATAEEIISYANARYAYLKDDEP